MPYIRNPRLKNKVDYHQNMNAECFCEWLERDLLKACNRYGISAILVMDNASYHCTPAEDSINVKSYTTKSVEDVDCVAVSSRPVRASLATWNMF